MTLAKWTASLVLLPAIVIWSGCAISDGNASSEARALQTTGTLYKVAGTLGKAPGLSAVGWGLDIAGRMANLQHKQ